MDLTFWLFHMLGIRKISRHLMNRAHFGRASCGRNVCAFCDAPGDDSDKIRTTISFLQQFYALLQQQPTMDWRA